MEKTASITAIIKGSTSAATEVIAVDVDPVALSCSRCRNPLVPPVFQDNKKCASCFISTGFTPYSIPTNYSRCNGVERILRSVGVACPNAIYGCTAGNDALPREGGARENLPNQSRFRAVAGMCPEDGPCGGGGGDPREMDVRGVDRIVKVVVWHRDCTVDSMSLVYSTYGRDGTEEQTGRWGIRAGHSSESEICLKSDEYLIGVKGHIGHHKNKLIVKSLTFISNRHTFGPYGKEEGTPFELAAAGGRIVGFHGRSGQYLDALGTDVKMEI